MDKAHRVTSVPYDHRIDTLTFGHLLWQLRRRASMTLDDLAAAVGYHRAHISNLEKGKRRPDIATVLDKFIPALGLQGEPRLARQLLELAAASHGGHLPADLSQPFVADTPEMKSESVLGAL